MTKSNTCPLLLCMLSGHFYPYKLNGSIQHCRVSGEFNLYHFNRNRCKFYANSTDLDQKMRFLIKVCTVCHCSIYGTLSKDALKGCVK